MHYVNRVQQEKRHENNRKGRQISLLLLILVVGIVRCVKKASFVGKIRFLRSKAALWTKIKNSRFSKT